MSTFEIFTQLPLFKELERDALFSLIPKISLDFEHFDAGQSLFQPGSPVAGLVFLLQGRVLHASATDEREGTGPALLSWENLFGKDTVHRSGARTLTACSTLTVDKRSLLYLLREEPGFLEAYLNLLYDTMNQSHN